MSSWLPGCLPGLLRWLSGAVSVASSVLGGACRVQQGHPRLVPRAHSRGQGWDVGAWVHAVSPELSVGGKKHGEGVSGTHGWGSDPFVGT